MSIEGIGRLDPKTTTREALLLRDDVRNMIRYLSPQALDRYLYNLEHGNVDVDGKPIPLLGKTVDYPDEREVEPL